MELFAASNAAAQCYRCMAAAIRIRDFVQVTLPVLHGASCGRAAGERNGLAKPSTDGNELEEAHAVLGVGRYEKGDACGAGCPFPEPAEGGAAVATAEQLPRLRQGCWSPCEPPSSISSLLHHRRYRTLFPHPVPSTGENDVVTRWGMKITGAKVQYLFLPPELRGSYEIMHINNWLRSTLL